MMTVVMHFFVCLKTVAAVHANQIISADFRVII